MTLLKRTDDFGMKFEPLLSPYCEKYPKLGEYCEEYFGEEDCDEEGD
jgi:hypothetical protein